MENHLVIFNLAHDLYGVSIAAVSEIITRQPITRVPRAPAFVEGVINLRGKVLPVIDLRKRFGLAQGADTPDTRIVVAEINRTQVGMVVDAVSQVLRVPDTAIEPPSPVVATVDSAFVSGIAKVGSRLIVLLDLEKVLQTDEKAALPQVALPPESSSQAAEGLAAAGPPAGPAAVGLGPAPSGEAGGAEAPCAEAGRPPQGPPGEPLPASPKKRKRKGPRRLAEA